MFGLCTLEWSRGLYKTIHLNRKCQLLPHGHFLKYLLRVPLFTVLSVAHLSSRFLSSKLFFFFFCSSSGPNKGSDQSSEQVWQAQTRHAAFCCDRNGDFTDSCITWLNAVCPVRRLLTKQGVTVFVYTSLKEEASSWRISVLFVEEKITKSTFGERGVAAWLVLLMEELIKGSSSEFLLYFWHFS